MIPKSLSPKDESKGQLDTFPDQRPSFSPASVAAMIVGIILLIVLIHIGFFPTYLKYFPQFNDVIIEGRGNVSFTAVKHFHGMMMMGWIFMLLLQPILIRTGKLKLHRLVGYTSYILAPLVLLSLYLINQHAYHQNLETAGQPVAVAVLTLTFPALVFFAVLYFLAIR
jgi:hypothetical protein